MKAQDAIRRLKREGAKIERQTGSHVQIITKDGVRITVPNHRGDLKPGTEQDIKKKAGWK